MGHWDRKVVQVDEDGTPIDVDGVTPVGLDSLLFGEDPDNNRFKTEIQPAPEDAILTTLQNVAVAVGNGTAIDMKGYVGLGVVVDVGGTPSLTVAFEATLDDTLFLPVGLVDASSGSIALTATADGFFYLPSGVRMSQFRARVSIFATGTVTVKALQHPR